MTGEQTCPKFDTAAHGFGLVVESLKLRQFHIQIQPLLWVTTSFITSSLNENVYGTGEASHNRASPRDVNFLGANIAHTTCPTRGRRVTSGKLTDAGFIKLIACYHGLICTGLLSPPLAALRERRSWLQRSRAHKRYSPLPVY